MVDSHVKDYLIQQAKIRDYKVVVTKLNQEQISQWGPKTTNSWDDIDPYLDIEEVQDSSTMPTDDKAEPNPLLKVETMPSGNYDLRTRKKISRSTTWPLQKAKSDVCYTNGFSHIKDIPDTPKQPKHTIHASVSGPSASRVAACGHQTVQPSVSHPVPISKPQKP